MLELQDELLRTIQEGESELAVHIAAASLALKEVNLPRGVQAWQASLVPVDQDPTHHSLRALDARNRNFGGDRSASHHLLEETRRRQAAASRAVSELGHFSLKDNNPNGSIAWRSPDGDLNAVLVNTLRPHTERAAGIIAAVEEAGYQNGATSQPVVEVSNPFHATNPYQNAAVYQAQQ